MLNQLARPPLVVPRPFPLRGASARLARPPLIGAGQGVGVAAPPVTSYTNHLGSGDRTATIGVTLTATALDALTAGALKLFDGNLTASGAGSIQPLGTVNAGEGLLIDYKTRKYSDESTLTYGLVPNNGDWIIRVFNDPANRIQVAAFTWNQQVQVVPYNTAVIDPAGYRFKEWLCPLGHGVTNDWFIEWTDKIANGV